MTNLKALLRDLTKGSVFLCPYGRQWTKTSPAGDGVVHARCDGVDNLFVGNTLRYTCSRDDALTDLRSRLATVDSDDPFTREWQSRETLEYRIQLMGGQL